MNVRTLLKFLSQYPHTQDMYMGKPSLDRPIEATERLGDNKMVRLKSPLLCRIIFLKLCPVILFVKQLFFFPASSQKPVNFWFATGGAGFCVSRGLALKMSPWARWVFRYFHLSAFISYSSLKKLGSSLSKYNQK